MEHSMERVSLQQGDAVVQILRIQGDPDYGRDRSQYYYYYYFFITPKRQHSNTHKIHSRSLIEAVERELLSHQM